MMYVCQAVELKEGLYGQAEYSIDDGKIKDYTFKQFNTNELTKKRTISIPEHKKTPLQESVEEIQEWQNTEKWEKSKTKKQKEFNCKCIYLIGLVISGLGLVILTFMFS